MRNKRNKAWMAACALVVIVAFGSACSTTQTHQITKESFRTLQKDADPKPTHVIKTTGGKLVLARGFRDNLGILRNNLGPMQVDPKFTMTDTEIRLPGKKSGLLADQYEAMTVPLDEIAGYYITDKTMTGLGAFGIIAGVAGLALVALFFVGFSGDLFGDDSGDDS